MKISKAKRGKKKVSVRWRTIKKGKYKVRVRAYRTAGGKTYYGTWSRYKSFKVK